MYLKLSPGKLPNNANDTRSLAQAMQTRRLVATKISEMAERDNTPKDIAPALNQVAVVDEKLRGVASTLGFNRKEVLTGTAQFDEKGEATKLNLTTHDQRAAYRFELLEDGSKVYAAPTGEDFGVHQVVVERSDGTLFIDDSVFGTTVDLSVRHVVRHMDPEQAPKSSASPGSGWGQATYPGWGPSTRLRG